MSNNHGGARVGAGRKPSSYKYIHKEFTPEQLKILIDCPHIYAVSKKSVSYTKAFKELFWQRYCDGIDPKVVFEEAGIDVKIITRERINGLVKTLRSQSEKGLSFTEGSEPTLEADKLFDFPTPPRRANNVYSPNLSDTDIANLVNQVSYMSQELAFLKKIILAERRNK